MRRTRRHRGAIRFRATAGVIVPGAAETMLRTRGRTFVCTQTYTPPRPSPGAWITARVPFSGPAVEGGLRLLMSAATARGLLGPKSLVEDGVGELANELTGRFVNRFVARGLAFRVQPPQVDVRGSADFPIDDNAQAWSFVDRDEAFWVAVDAEVGEGFTLGDGLAGGAFEGQVVLFSR